MGSIWEWTPIALLLKGILAMPFQLTMSVVTSKLLQHWGDPFDALVRLNTQRNAHASGHIIVPLAHQCYCPCLGANGTTLARPNHVLHVTRVDVSCPTHSCLMSAMHRHVWISLPWYVIEPCLSQPTLVQHWAMSKWAHLDAAPSHVWVGLPWCSTKQHLSHKIPTN